MGHTWVLPSISHGMGKSRKSTHWEKPEKLVPILFPKCGSFSSDSQLMVCFITREIHWSTYQYPMGLEKALKPTLREEPGKLVSILSPKYDGFRPSNFHPMVLKGNV